MAGTAKTDPMNTSDTYLLQGTKASSTVTYAELVPIKSMPAMGAAPSKIECTDLTQKRKAYTQGLEDSEDMEFICNYTKANYDKCKALQTGEAQYFAVAFGGKTVNDAVDGITYIKGYPYAFKNGAETDAVREFTFGITALEVKDTAIS